MTSTVMMSARDRAREQITMIYDRKCSTWFAELLFPIIGSVQIYTAFFFTALFGDLMYYHGLLLLPCLLFLTGVAGNFAGFTVNYERFARVPQSRKLMVCAAFVSITSAFISYFYLWLYISSKLHLANMQLYSEDEFTKKMIDKTQILLQCCGNDCYSDWFSVDWQGTDIEPWHSYPPSGVMSRLAVPYSCCSWNSSPPCTNNYLKLQDGQGLNKEGCKRALVVRVTATAFMQATALLAVGLLQVSWLICTDSQVAIVDVEGGNNGRILGAKPSQGLLKRRGSRLISATSLHPVSTTSTRPLSTTSTRPLSSPSTGLLSSRSSRGAPSDGGSSSSEKDMCGIGSPISSSSSSTSRKGKGRAKGRGEGSATYDGDSVEMSSVDLSKTASCRCLPKKADGDTCICLFPPEDEEISGPAHGLPARSVSDSALGRLK